MSRRLPGLFACAVALLAALTACDPKVAAPPTVTATSAPNSTPRPSGSPFQFGTPVFPDVRPSAVKPADPVATKTPTPGATATPKPMPTASLTPDPDPTLPPPTGVLAYDLPTLGVNTTTMHGGSGSGNADGYLTSMKLKSPVGLAFGADGTIYIADSGNHSIRRSMIEDSPSGPTRVGSVYAGTGTAGFLDAQVGQAKFNTPKGVAIGPGGAIFVADAGNHCIRKIFVPLGAEDPTEITLIVAGSRTAGYLDAVSTDAQFDDPTGIAIDKDGNAFVTDTGNHCIRKITPAGVVTTLAGIGRVAGHQDGAGRAAKFSSPRGIVVDATGNLYVCDTGNDCIRKITSAGVVSTYAGTPGTPGFKNGPLKNARFDGPTGIALGTNDTLYVSDFSNNRVRKLAKDGDVTTFAGTGVAGALDGPGAYSTFQGLQGIVVQPNSQDLFVAEEGNHTIRNLLLEHAVSTQLGSTTPGSTDDRTLFATFRLPFGIARDVAGNFYIADAGNHVIRKADPQGRVTTLAGTAGSTGDDDGTGAAARFDTPRSVAVDKAGNVYVADEGNHLIRKITPAGKVTTLAGDGRPRFADGLGHDASFNVPRGIAIDADGNLFVADNGNHRIRKVTPAGDVSTYAGSGTSGYADDEATKARFTKPSGVSVDATGRVYVADLGNNAIRLITKENDAVKVGTFAGGTGTPGYQDGPGGSAQFNDPWGLVVDAVGRVFVADYGNCLIRKISPDGTVSTYAGEVSATTGNPVAGYADGRASQARFAAPSGVVIDELGYVYVVDSENHCIRRLH